MDLLTLFFMLFTFGTSFFANAVSIPNPHPATWPADGDYIRTVIKHHNVHRLNHSAHRMQWSQDLADKARTLATTCHWGHNVQIGGGGYGQNIQAGSTRSHISQAITDSWYNGEVIYYAGYYGMTNPPFNNFDSWGHFSQVVWKNSHWVGCYTADCTGPGLREQGSNQILKGINPWFTVCNYQPPGNMGGGYGINVGRPLGHPTVGGQY